MTSRQRRPPAALDDRDPVGWGRQADAVSAQEREQLAGMLAGRFGPGALWSAAPPAHVLPAPRVGPPSALVDLVAAGDHPRLLHAAGRSFSDMVALRETGLAAAPDVVMHPADADEVEAVLGWCADAGLACVPYGGGTSVVGGVDTSALDVPSVVLSTAAMDRVTEVDRVSRAARVQAGTAGPALEAQLRPHGLTMRFFPQSFECSTLGGWVATRAGGHYATRLTHIDDLVESVDAVTPSGRWASRRLPGSGAGPSPDRLLLGSEGILGIITDAWVRLQDRPRHRAGASVAFDDLQAALAALRHLVQSGLDPANCRVLDPLEALLNGAGDGSGAVMVVGCESAHVPVAHDMAVAVELLADHGGRPGPIIDRGDRAAQPSTRPSGAVPAAAPAGGTAMDPAQAWKQSFTRAPYLRDAMVDLGMIAETFETAATWDQLPQLIDRVTTATRAAVDEVCGDGMVSCRITHAYPDGAAPYFTVYAPGRPGARVRQWAQVKDAASAALLAAGGTITHHHAVGRDHRPWYDRQRPAPFAEALRAVRRTLDPAGIMNPGVLLDP